MKLFDKSLPKTTLVVFRKSSPEFLKDIKSSCWMSASFCSTHWQNDTAWRPIQDCFFFLSRYPFTPLAVCLWSLSCWKVRPLPITCFPDDIELSVTIWYNFINLAKSPKPLAEMRSQTMSEPPASFINGCRHSLLHVSPNLLHTYLTIISTKSFTIGFINPSDLFLCNLKYPSLLKNVFVIATFPMRPFMMRSQWLYFKALIPNGNYTTPLSLLLQFFHRFQFRIFWVAQHILKNNHHSLGGWGG